MAPKRTGRSPRVLVLDIGGSHVKAGFSHRKTEIKVPSGPNLSPEKMVRKLLPTLKGERCEVVSIGYPGLVVHGRPASDPPHLGKGWVGFDFEEAFQRPTRVINDAAMQALGSYHGGRMLFLGLGTGLGSAMIVDGRLEPMELGHLPYKKDRTYEDYVGEAGLERLGRKRWQKEVFDITETLSHALEPDYVVLGGGNVRKMKSLPPLAERGDNRNAILGGIRLWDESDPAATASAAIRSAPRRAARGRR